MESRPGWQQKGHRMSRPLGGVSGKYHLSIPFPGLGLPAGLVSGLELMTEDQKQRNETD